MANLEDSKSKIDWAKRQLPEMEATLKRFFDSSPFELFQEPSTDGSKEYVKLRLVKQIPREIPHLIGDIIHNLRAALDYAACDLAVANGASNVDGVYFPFGKTKDALTASAKGKLKKLSPHARQYITDLKPYRGGNEILWLVHYLDLGDKHRKLTPIGLTGSTGANIERLAEGGISFAAPKWESFETGMRVATLTKGAQWCGKISANVTVAFGEVQSIANTPIESLIQELARVSDAVVQGLDQAFFN